MKHRTTGRKPPFAIPMQCAATAFGAAMLAADRLAWPSPASEACLKRIASWSDTVPRANVALTNAAGPATSITSNTSAPAASRGVVALEHLKRDANTRRGWRYPEGNAPAFRVQQRARKRTT